MTPFRNKQNTAPAAAAAAAPIAPPQPVTPLPPLPPATLGHIYSLMGQGTPEAISTAEQVLAQARQDALMEQALQPQGGMFTSIGRWIDGRRAGHLTKSLTTGGKLSAAMRRQESAATQGSVVNASMDAFDAYGNSAAGVVDPATATTFRMLRSMAHHCEPAAAIIEKRVQQVAAFAQPAKMRGTKVASAGFRFVMTEEDEEATPGDKKAMRELTKLIVNCGYGPPPEENRSINWQPGFEPFVRQITRDTLTLDWVAVRRWKGSRRPDLFALFAFAAEDAGTIRNIRGRTENVKDGVRVRTPYVRLRRDTSERIETVKVDNDTSGGQVVEEFSAFECVTTFRNPRTDESACGYGYSELERAVNAITIWLFAREYNSSRFRTDSLPRGILTLFGAMNETQMNNFRLKWKEMFQGNKNRWGFPIISGSDKNSGSAQWIDLDRSSRDMEYHQFMFAVSIWLHALFGMHPEESGFESLSPFKPPLSQASPETRLKYSQDSGLSPILRWLAAFINREIVPYFDKTGRYQFEWVGLGENDAATDAATTSAQLAAGQTTPRAVMNASDVEIVDWLKDCPMLDMPMPLEASMPLFLQMLQTAQAMHQQKQQEAMQQQAQQMMQQQQGGMPGQGSPRQGGPPQQGGMPGIPQGPGHDDGSGGGSSGGDPEPPGMDGAGQFPAAAGQMESPDLQKALSGARLSVTWGGKRNTGATKGAPAKR